LVLTDMRMPGMDGVQLAQAILKRCPELPVLFVSGRCDLIPPEINCGYIPKPFSSNDLVSRVAEYLNRPQNQVGGATGSW
jgi:CheY-like chemotaxis protein